MLLVPHLGVTEASCCLFERIRKLCSMSQDQPAIPMGKQLGWAHKLGGTESQGVSKAGKNISQVDGVSDMTPTYSICGSVEEGLRKRTMAST